MTTQTLRTVQLVSLSSCTCHVVVSQTEAAAISALQEDLKAVWAQLKHDAGLTGNAEPVFNQI